MRKIPSFPWDEGWKISPDGEFLYVGDMPPDNHEDVFLSDYFTRDGRYTEYYRDLTLGGGTEFVFIHGREDFGAGEIVSALRKIDPGARFPQRVVLAGWLSGNPRREMFSIVFSSFEEVKLFLGFFAGTAA